MNSDSYKKSLCTLYIYRRSTSNLFRFPYKINDPIGVSHYDQEFYDKAYAKRSLIRTGSSSGFRNNNPHPSKVTFTILHNLVILV